MSQYFPIKPYSLNAPLRPPTIISKESNYLHAFTENKSRLKVERISSAQQLISDNE